VLFNTVLFWLFFVVVWLLHRLTPKAWRWGVLLIASYTFYGVWSPPYLLLLAVSTTVDWWAASRMAAADRRGARRAWLGVSITSNLGMLGVFKYWDFFNQSAVDLFAFGGFVWDAPELGLLLPVGISFYTFQTLSYSVDVYRGKLEPEPNLLRFALYVSFFPQLVAGPIERAGHLMPQLRSGGSADTAAMASGAQRALWGLFKKVVIADRLALYVDAVYTDPATHSAPTLLLATYAFAFQIYADFSGYSDIAIGCARMLGYDLRENFRRPYLATSIRDFWRRWHISLSNWLRDYVYIPLGGSRHGERRTIAALVITMLLGGLWHGASWTFVIWGGLQGLMLVGSRATLARRDRWWAKWGDSTRVRDVFRVIVTFHLVCLSWVFFRAESLADAVGVLEGIASRPGNLFIDPHTLSHASLGLLVLVAVEGAQALRASSDRPVHVPAALRLIGAYALCLLVVLAGVAGGSQFIYFQF